MTLRPVALAFAVVATAFLSGCQPQSAAPVEFSQEEIDEYLTTQEQSARNMLLARFPDADVPDARFIRFVDHSEWVAAIVDCMTGLGFSAAPDGDGGVQTGPTPPEQEEAEAVASYTCRTSYPIHPRFSLPLTVEQRRALYNYYVHELVPCLEREGYEQDAPPTWQSFDEGFEGGSWLPYDAVEITSMDEWRRINDVCPQGPPGIADSR